MFLGKFLHFWENQQDESKGLLREAEGKAFIKLFGAILRLRNILSSFDDFNATDKISEHDKEDKNLTFIHNQSIIKKNVIFLRR